MRSYFKFRMTESAARCVTRQDLSVTEKRYAVIEKEALATTWAGERFSDYVLGIPFTLETDHKPLTVLLNSSELSKMPPPPRILRFRLRRMRYSYQVQYVPGKHQVTADTLSRAPAGLPGIEDKLLVEEVEAFSIQTTSYLPATPNRLQQIRDAQKVDEECSLLRSYCLHGWPPYLPHQPLLRPYWENRSHLTIVDDLLLYDDRIVIPRSMRLQILDCIHTGHVGLTKCRSRARTSVWWPGLSTQIGELITRRHTCAKEQPTPREPLLPSSFPGRPWERVATDLYDFQGRKYIIVVDYYSRWFDIKELSDETSHSVIKALREVFATHGIPDVIMSDNGPQYSAETFRQFAEAYHFTHVTSSPKYPQANGEVERAIRTAKSMLRKNEDIFSALLTHRSTPLQNGYSPSELLMGRRLQTQLPTLSIHLYPKVQIKDRQLVEEKESLYRLNQQRNFNRRHRAKELPTLELGGRVWIRDQDRYGLVTGKTEKPRSYLVTTERGTLRRNRSALVTAAKPAEAEQHSAMPACDVTPASPVPVIPVLPVPSTPSRPQTTQVPPSSQTAVPVATLATALDECVPPRSPSPAVLTTRSGRAVRPPERLNL